MAMITLHIDGQPHPVREAATLGMTRADQMPPAGERSYRLELLKEQALPHLQRPLDELADDLRRFGQVDFEVERRWLELGLPTSSVLWVEAPDLLAELFMIGLTRDLLESVLMSVGPKDQVTVYLEPDEVRVSCRPDALVLEGRAWPRSQQ
jgi:hypothetical protein